VILLCPLAAADEKVEPKPSLTIEAEVTKPERLGKRLSVRLVNAGKAPLTVVTNKLHAALKEDGDKVTVTLEMVEKKTHKDRFVVPAADTLGLVKLMPGEVAVVSLPVAPFQKGLGKLGPKATVTVSYEVSEFWGKRFGAWHGKIKTTAALAKE
jgi:hypothetical protein